jgi:hypothetical protein
MDWVRVGDDGHGLAHSLKRPQPLFCLDVHAFGLLQQLPCTALPGAGLNLCALRPELNLPRVMAATNGLGEPNNHF